jgi:hypothetical protein
MKNKGQLLYELYKKDFEKLTDLELLKAFEAYSEAVNFSHSFKDEVALETAGELIINRKLKTLEELRAIVSEDEKNIKKYLNK